MPVNRPLILLSGGACISKPPPLAGTMDPFLPSTVPGARFPWGHCEYIGNDSEMRELLKQPLALLCVAGVLSVCRAPLVAGLLRIRRRKPRLH
jgi:hypothetical protein